ncbi:hypothetical protein Hanom_Chr11g01047001 [Helianthus anomalus]
MNFPPHDYHSPQSYIITTTTNKPSLPLLLPITFDHPPRWQKIGGSRFRLNSLIYDGILSPKRVSGDTHSHLVYAPLDRIQLRGNLTPLAFATILLMGNQILVCYVVFGFPPYVFVFVRG